MIDNKAISTSPALRPVGKSSDPAPESKSDNAPAPWTRRSDVAKSAGNDIGKAAYGSGNLPKAQYKASSFLPSTSLNSENPVDSRVPRQNEPVVPQAPQAGAGRVRQAGSEVMEQIRNNPFGSLARPKATIFAALAFFAYKLVRPSPPIQK